MKHLTHTQHAAYDAACLTIDHKRANEIRRMKNWEHGMCGCLNAVKPNVPDVTAEENAAIRALWQTLPGTTCWMDALYLLCNQTPAHEMEDTP